MQVLFCSCTFDILHVVAFCFREMCSACCQIDGVYSPELFDEELGLHEKI
jgi:hypothetical protein